MKREDFVEGRGYVAVTWDAEVAMWRFRPVTVGVALTDADAVAMGLNVPARGGGVRPAVMAYSQRDSRWADAHLGRTRYTMRGAGCAVTACTMVASVVQPAITPLAVVNWLNENGGFTSGGLLYWAKFADFVDGLRFVNYYLWRNRPADLVLLARALDRGPQVVQVDFKPVTAALDSHFVTVTAMAGDADVRIIDPWTGEAGTLLGLYARPGWTLARAVYAMAEFEFEF